MRRGLEIRMAFAPTRMSAVHLRAAYEVVSPVIERIVIVVDSAEQAVADECERAIERKKQGGRK
jgi:hypothetical protein